MSRDATLADPRRGDHPLAMSDAELKALFEQVSNWGRWGEDDELGALNYVGPDQIKAAAGLVRQGKVVWVGPLSAPWEDADCDTIILNKQDYDATVLRTLPDGRKVP